MLPSVSSFPHVHNPSGSYAGRIRPVLAKVPKTLAKDSIRAEQIAWLDRVVETTGLSLSRIATDIGMGDTTLTRFRNSKTYQGLLSQMTVQQVSDLSGIPGPGVSTLSTPRGLREDGARYQSESTSVPHTAVNALLRGRPNARPWVMKSDVLTLAGIRPGDILIIDQSLEARDGDIVCAQIEVGLGARTVFRLYQRPNLIGASFDPSAIRPEIVDGSRVRIVGPMTDLLRHRA